MNDKQEIKELKERIEVLEKRPASFQCDPPNRAITICSPPKDITWEEFLKSIFPNQPQALPNAYPIIPPTYKITLTL